MISSADGTHYAGIIRLQKQSLSVGLQRLHKVKCWELDLGPPEVALRMTKLFGVSLILTHFMLLTNFCPRWVQFDGLHGILKSKVELLHFQEGQGAVAVEREIFAVDRKSLSVVENGLFIFLAFDAGVALIFEFLHIVLETLSHIES